VTPRLEDIVAIAPPPPRPEGTAAPWGETTPDDLAPRRKAHRRPSLGVLWSHSENTKRSGTHSASLLSAKLLILLVGEVGLEPTKASASGFTVRPLCRSGHSPARSGHRIGESPRALYGRLPKASQSKTGPVPLVDLRHERRNPGKGRSAPSGEAMNETARNSL
jgi:hypothetical protein